MTLPAEWMQFASVMLVSRLVPTIQIRNVPVATHDLLKAMAAERGLSLNQFLLSEIGRLAPAIAPADWVREIRRHAPAGPLDRGDAARLVREGRDAREQQITRAVRGER